jgi:GNAT superfamily N-acetyltransferase
MPDMLTKLYALPDWTDLRRRLEGEGVTVRRALAPERHVVVAWVRAQFNEAWASETGVAFARSPVACHIAQQGAELLGFACHDATCKGFFGPTGVVEAHRGRGLGKALLFAALEAMRAEGYAYAIIGGAGPVEFYARAVGATAIAGSEPGVYRGMLGG